MFLRAIKSILLLALCCVGPGRGAEPPALQFGSVTVNPKERTVSFPVVVNMREGLVEYAVVHESGKVHESLFKTAVRAQEVQAAALLFSERNAAGGVVFPKVEAVEARWVVDGKTNAVAMGALVKDVARRVPAVGMPWIYRGSRVVEGVFLAERDGSIVALIGDMDALVDQEAADPANDENWQAIGTAMPGTNEAVTVVVRFAGK